jgi:hypothetical protein
LKGTECFLFINCDVVVCKTGTHLKEELEERDGRRAAKEAKILAK